MSAQVVESILRNPFLLVWQSDKLRDPISLQRFSMDLGIQCHIQQSGH